MDIVNLNPMVAPIQPVEPNGSRGGTFIYVIVVIVLLVSLVAAGFFFYKSQKPTVIDLSKSAGPSPGPSPGTVPTDIPEDDSSENVEPPEDDSSENVEPLDTEPTTVKQSAPQIDIASVVKFVTPPTSTLNDLKTNVKLVTPVIAKAKAKAKAKVKAEAKPTPVEQEPQNNLDGIRKRIVFVTPPTENTSTSTLNDLKTDVKLVTPVIAEAKATPPPTLGGIRDRIKF